MTPPLSPRKFLLVGPLGSGVIVRARELAAESRLFLEHDGERLLPAPSAHAPNVRVPHHTTSEVGLFGALRGHQWRLGEIALANRGTLILHDAPEFRRVVLERLAAVWTARELRLANPYNSLTIPAVFDLILTMARCPCGVLGHPRLSCRCTSEEISRHFERLPPALVAGAVRIDLEEQ